MGEFKIVVAEAIKPVLGSAPVPFSKLELFAERAGLPASIIEDPSGFAPLHAIEHFLNIVHMEVGDPTFLFNSLVLDNTERHQKHSVVGVPLHCGATRKEALELMVKAFNGAISGTRFSCETQNNLLWLTRTSSATDWSDNWSVLQYNLSIVTRGLHRVIGRNIHPVALCLPKVVNQLELPEELMDVKVALCGERFGIAFDLASIATAPFSLKVSAKMQNMQQSKQSSELKYPELFSCVSKFVVSPKNGRLTDCIARSFGISPRTYRRQLARIGTTHAQLLSDIRLDLALSLLSDFEIRITEIAFELGYSHPGDFTRYFRGRMGVSPQEYRRMLAIPKPGLTALHLQ